MATTLLVLALALAATATGAAATETWQYTGDSCNGVRQNPLPGLEDVYYVVSASNVYDSSWASRKCPDGMTWMSSAAFASLWAKPTSNAQCNVPPKPWTYYNQCGWNSYIGQDGKSRRYFLFNDTPTTSTTYMHAGNYPCHFNTINVYAGLTQVAGLICHDIGDRAPPQFAADAAPELVPGSVTDSAASARATLDEPGTLHCVAVDHDAAGGDPTPTPAEVKSGLGGAHPTASSPEGTGVLTAAFSGLEPATLYHLWCVAEDDEPTVQGNLQDAATDAGDVFTGGCADGDAAVVTPSLVEASSRIDGADLVLQWASSRHYTQQQFVFRGAAAEADARCSMQAAVPTGTEPAGDEWSYFAEPLSCDDRFTFRRNLADTLAACGFAEDGSDDDFAEYRATVDVTASEPAGGVFGTDVSRVERSAVRLGVRVPKAANAASGDAEVAPAFDAAQGTFSAQTALEFELATSTATVRLATAAAWPYRLSLAAATPVEDVTAPPGVWDTLSVAAADGGDDADCASAGTACTQRWAVTLAAGAGQCELDGTYRVSFAVSCADGYEGDCVPPEVASATVDLVLSSDDFCPQVVEVADVTATLLTYSDAPGGTEATDFVLQSTVHARVAVVVEGALEVDKVELTGVDITSQGDGGSTVTPFSDLDAAATAYSFAWDGAAGQAGVAQADFSFQLNDNSVSFPGGVLTGQADVVLTARVTVHYTDAAGQAAKRDVAWVQARAPQQLAAPAASAKFSAAPASGGPTASSGSTAGSSTVLGVSAGVAAVAAVGVVAVAAVAAGAAVAAKKRRRRARGRKAGTVATSSMGDLRLDTVTAAAQPPQYADEAVQISTGDLARVQDAYGAAAAV